MKIIQTFWSCNKEVLQNDFGWLSSQYHIMAWVLSCLKLREYYDDISLYTDSNGYKIFIEYLHLPYKKVELCYNNLNDCDEHFWALPKILTYAEQKEPFIHVDGDVFIWEKLSSELESAILVAQNVETVTGYYTAMMHDIGKEICYVPKLLRRDLIDKPMYSYNAGIIGGADIPFFKKYTGIALDLVAKNRSCITSKAVATNFNILFEQLLFAALAKKEEKNVTCYFKEPIEDKGYLPQKMADFPSVPGKVRYIHLVGPCKKTEIACKLMCKILFQEYPEYFLKVAALFQEEHRNYDTKISWLTRGMKSESIRNRTEDLTFYQRTTNAIALCEGYFQPSSLHEINTQVVRCGSAIIKELFNYESQLKKIIYKWDRISKEDLFSAECAHRINHPFFFAQEEQQLKTIIEKNRFLEIVETCFDWTNDITGVTYKDVMPNSFDPTKEINIACVPGLFFKGFSEIAIDELEYNILAILNIPMTFKKLLTRVEVCFTPTEVQKKADVISELILLKLKRLSINNCIVIK